MVKANCNHNALDTSCLSVSRYIQWNYLARLLLVNRIFFLNLMAIDGGQGKSLCKIWSIVLHKVMLSYSHGITLPDSENSTSLQGNWTWPKSLSQIEKFALMPGATSVHAYCRQCRRRHPTQNVSCNETGSKCIATHIPSLIQIDLSHSQHR